MQDHTPREQNNEAAENERLRFALAAAGIGTWDLDPVNNIVFWDERCRELYGFVPGEAVPYEEVLRYMHPDDAPVVHAAVQRALDPNTPGDYEVRYRTIGADGRLRWVLSKGKAYFTAAGSVYRFAGTAQDITQTLQEQERVAASEQIARVALENSNSGYFRYNTVTGELEHSPVYARIFTGTESRQLSRQDALQHIHPADLAIRNKAMEDAAETGRIEYEVRTIWTDGSIHWVRAKGNTINSIDGKQGIITGTVYDTTAQHEQKAAVKEAEALLANAFNGSSIGMAFTDSAGRLLNINTAYADTLGYEPEELIGINFRDLTHPDDLDRNIPLFEDLIAGRRGYFTIEKRYLHKDGSPRWVHLNVTLVPGVNGTETRTLTIARDITAERESEEELAATQAMFRNVTNSSPTGLWLSDTEGGLTYLNKTLVIWSGRPYEDLLGAGWAASIYEADREHTAQAYSSAIAARAHYDTLFRIYKSDGTTPWCRVSGDPYYDENGEYAGYAGYCMDIDEIISGQQALAAGEARFRSLIEEAPVATCLFVGRELKIEIANDIMIGFWGKGPGVIGMPLAQAVPELEGQPFLQLLDEVYTTGVTYEAEGMYAELPVAGVMTPYYFDFTYKPLRNAAGEVYAIMEMAVDVTARITAQQTIKENQEQLLASFHQAPVSITIISKDNLTFRMANARYAELVERRPEDLIGKPLLEALPELEGQGFDRLLQNVIDTGVPFVASEVPVTLLRQGRPEVTYLDFTYQPQYEKGNVIAGVLVVAVEVTQQVKARKNIEESEARFRSLIEEAPVATALFVGRDMIIELANETMIGYWGKGNTVLGKPLIEALPELEGQPFLELLDRVFTTGETFTATGMAANLEVDGLIGRYYFDFTYKPLRNEQGEVYAIMNMAVDVTAEVTAKNALEEAKKTLELAIEVGELAIYNLDLISNTATYSQRFIDWFGLAGQYATSEEISARTHPDDAAGLTEAIKRVIVEGGERRYDVVYRIIHPETKQVRYVRSIGQVQMEGDAPITVSGILQDVTEDAAARKALEESELFTRSIIDNSPVAKIVFVGEDMKVSIINQNMLAMLGRDASIIGMPFMEAMPELKDTPLMDRLRAVYVTGETYYQPEERLDLLKHGVHHTGYYNYIYKALYNTAGDIYGIIVTAVEVTEQVLARRQIEVAEESLRDAIELAELGTWSINLPALEFDYSRRLRDWMGFAPDKVITVADAYSVIAEEDRRAVREALLAAAAPQSQGTYDVTYTIFNKNTGRERIIHAQGRTLFNDAGEAYKITGTAQDITAQRKVQLALEEEVQERTIELQAVNEELISTNEELAESNTQLMHSNEELAQYAYVASHDLQEPLRKIRIFSDMLNKKETLTADSQELVGKISQSAERMSLLIRDLLEFSRLLKSDLLMQPVDLAEVAKMVTTDFELTITEKQARVRIGRLPAIQAVALQMNQLFYNLINNALKFSRAGVPPVININAEAITLQEAGKHLIRPLPFAQYYRLCFQDNGIGFDDQYAEQIFEVFKRLHGRDIYPGSGIGLALCRRIVANHQGTMFAASTPGEGATFYIILPDRQQE